MSLCNYRKEWVYDVNGCLMSPINGLTRFILAGEPFELIDGDNLKFNSNTLTKVFTNPNFRDMRVFVISVLGPQSSGKSTLLNFLFGSKFSTGTGRCTKGIYANCIHIDHQDYDMILVLDTEGLQSAEKDDEEFDRKITLFCLAVSHLVLINVKGDMHNSMKRLLEICILSLVQLEKAKMSTPRVCWIFNQNPVPDKLPFIKQIEGITDEVIGANPDARTVARIMEVQEEDLFVLSFAFNITNIPMNPDRGQMEDWRRCQPRSEFAVEVGNIAMHIREIMSIQGQKKQSHRLFEFMLAWTEMASENWKTIEDYPDLVSFADVKEMKDNRILLKASEEWERIFLKMNMRDHEHMIQTQLCDNIDKKRVHVVGYVKNQELTIKSKICEYFDGIYIRIEKKLTALAEEGEFRKQLVDIYRGKIKSRVDSYYQEMLNHATREIQRTVSEAGKLNGLAELEAKMKELLHSKQSYTEIEAADEFKKAYQGIVNNMKDELDFDGMDAQLFTSMKDVYRTQCTLPSTVVGDYELQKNMCKLVMNDSIESVTRQFVKIFFSGAQVLKPQPLQQSYNRITFSGVRKMEESSKYLNVLDYFDIVENETAFNPEDLLGNVEWEAVRNFIFTACSFSQKYSTTESQCKQRMTKFYEILSPFGFSFEQSFKHTITKLVRGGVSEFYARRQKEMISEFLDCYDCFSKKRSSPISPIPDLNTWSSLILPVSKGLSEYLIDKNLPYATLKDVPDIINWEKLRLHMVDVVENKDERFEFWKKLSAIFTEIQKNWGYRVNSEFAQKLEGIFNNSYLWGNRTGDLIQNLNKYSCFRQYPVVKMGYMRTVIHENELLHLPICDFLKKKGLDFFLKFKSIGNRKTLQIESQVPPKFVKLQGGTLQFDVRHDAEKCFRQGLLYLIDSDHMYCNEYEAVKELQNLILKNVKGGWESILLDLWKLIEKQINLEEVDQTTETQSISSFSVSLIKIIQTKVQVFIKNEVNHEFGRFGQIIDMDGISAFHYFALLCSWKLLSLGQRNRAMKEINGMQKDEENWQAYFISNVCSQPISASQAIAKNLLGNLVDEYIKRLQNKAAGIITTELTTVRDKFNSKVIQKELDDNLLFSNRINIGEEKLVLDYVTKQTEYVTLEFEKRFKKVFGHVKDQAVQGAQEELQKELKKLYRCISKLVKFLEDRDMQDMSSHVMFYGGDVNVFEVEASIANQKAFEFFTQFCEGKDISSFARFSSGLHNNENVMILKHRKSTHEIEIPLLYHFCVELLSKLDERIRNTISMNWGLVDMGLDILYNEFKNASIGCPETCPTCGRKCDQDVFAINHSHACELGHQIRGMSGVRLENGFASTETCEEIRNDRKIFLETENKWITWYEKKQKHKDWVYTSLQQNDSRLERIVRTRQCWDNFGTALCEFHSNNGIPIKFTPYSQSNSDGGTCHYIVVLDESGSMQGVRFNDALRGAIDFGNILFAKSCSSRLSALLFSSSVRVIFTEGDKNALSQLANAGYRGGGTDFDIALTKASEHIANCSNGLYSRHVILFYTDGNASYPSRAADMIKDIRNKKITVDLYAICEDREPTVLKRLCQELHPQDHASHLRSNITPDQLGLVMSEIIA